MKKILILFLFYNLSQIVGSIGVGKESKMNSYKKIVSFEINTEISFLDFSITYLKEVDPEEKSEIKSTRSTRHRIFLIKDMKGKTHEISITHGQLPARPYVFQVESRSFTLHTYRTPKNDSLFPDKFYIEEAI